MVYKKIRKILLAHGLPNAQYLLAPLDFYSPRATGRVEMSNPEESLFSITPNEGFHYIADKRKPKL